MSKNGRSNFFTISTVVIILIAFYYTAKVYFYKSELNKHFEISNLSTSFDKRDKVMHGRIFDPDESGKRTSYDVPYIHIIAEITNLTGDDINVAEIFPELKIEFKYGQKVFTPMEYRITNGVWKSNEKLKIDEDFLLLTYDEEGNSDNTFMNHYPEKLELNLSIQATNSVGMNLNELIFSEEINSWNVY